MGEETKDEGGQDRPDVPVTAPLRLAAASADTEPPTGPAPDRWGAKSRRHLHHRVDQMLESADRMLVVGVARSSGGDSRVMYERALALFPNTSPIELLGAMARVQHLYQQEIDADTEEIDAPDVPAERAWDGTVIDDPLTRDVDPEAVKQWKSEYDARHVPQIVDPQQYDMPWRAQVQGSIPAYDEDLVGVFRENEFELVAHDISKLPIAPTVVFKITHPERIEASPPGYFILIEKAGGDKSRILITEYEAPSADAHRMLGKHVLEMTITHFPDPVYVEWHNEAQYAAEVATGLYWSLWRRRELMKAEIQETVAERIEAVR